MKKKLIVGNDNGNSEHKIIIEDTLIKQPNVFTKISNLPNLDELNPEHIAKNVSDNLIVTIESDALNNGAASTYFVGNYAIKSGRNLTYIEVGAVNSKLQSEVPLVNTLAQIAGYTAAKSYIESPEKNELIVNIDMTTGLPVNQYSKQNARLFSDKFIGKHKVTAFLGNKKITTTLNFEYVKVLPEAVPTVFYLQNKNPEELKGYNFNNKKILHVSIGEGTADYPFTEDITFNPVFITGSNNGVGHAIQNVLPDFMSKKSLGKYTRQDFSKVLKDTKHKYHTDAVELIESELEDQAFSILNFVKQELSKTNNEADYILVYGGGSILMRFYLETKLKIYLQKTGVELIYVPEKLAVDIEAAGMYEFCNSNIFKSLKNTYLGKDK